jgi:hypothetical protein
VVLLSAVIRTLNITLTFHNQEVYEQTSSELPSLHLTIGIQAQDDIVTEWVAEGSLCVTVK